jgi:uncharacterized protein (TIGR02217 family)
MHVAQEIDVCPAYGWVVDPMFRTKVWALRNGQETRNADASLVRHRFLLPFQNIRNQDYLNNLRAAFFAVRGMKDTFLAKDYTQNSVVAMPFGTGDGVEDTFQLYARSTFGSARYDRLINRPQSATVAVNGVAAAATIDPLTGIVVFDTPPADEAELTWTGAFRVVVRFKNDSLPMSIDNRRGPDYAMNGSVELIEVFGE